VYGAQLKIRTTRFAAIIAEHRELIEAFRANDVERASRAIRIHLEGSFAQMSQQMRMIGLSD
jgi:DNA-binding GntR family transcriptional regulator